jgi:ech hydrogenase subunit C
MPCLSKSPWIIHYDASSCNGCDIEVLACLTPIFDVERLGVVNTGNPKHADIFLVTGAVNEQCKDVICNIYNQMPEPKVVVAVGICASSGGIFRECYNISGGVDSVIPVDVYVPGCAARPEAIVDGVVKALGVLEQKQHDMRAALKDVDKVVYQRAEINDAPAILGLQKIAYRSEAEIYGEDNLPAMQQTLEELQKDFARPEQVFLKAVVNGKIIGSVRGFPSDQATLVSRLIVHPFFQRHGIGQKLIEEIEKAFPASKRFEVFTGQRSEDNLRRLRKLGFQEFKTEPFKPALTWVHLQKERS